MLCVDEEAGIVQISKIDALGGTPVINLKPSYPVCDRVPDARIPEWMPEEGLGL